MNAVALALFAAWFVVVFVVRSVVRKRTTGDSGIRRGAFAADASLIERSAYLLLVIAFAGAIAAPVAAMAGLAPLTENDLVPVVGVVIAIVGALDRTQAEQLAERVVAGLPRGEAAQSRACQTHRRRQTRPPPHQQTPHCCRGPMPITQSWKWSAARAVTCGPSRATLARRLAVLGM